MLTQREPSESFVAAVFPGYRDDDLLLRWPIKIPARYGETGLPGSVEASVGPFLHFGIRGQISELLDAWRRINIRF